jgi:hypothetical protein
MARRRAYTLSELAELIPQTTGQRAIELRMLGRELAARDGIPVPEWCAKRIGPPRASKPAVVVRREAAPSVAVDVAPVSTEIPDALQQWRRRVGNGACVCISRNGVLLSEHGHEARHFPDAAAAIAAVAS